MIYQDAAGRIHHCDAHGQCAECALDMPLELWGDDELLCFRCIVGRLEPAFAEGRQHGRLRGQVMSGSIRMYVDAWAGEVCT